MLNTFHSIKRLSGAVLLAVLASGCGSSSDPNFGYPPQQAISPGSCPVGTYYNGFACAYLGGSNSAYNSYDNCSVVSTATDGSNGYRIEKSCPVGEIRFPRLTSATDTYSAWVGPAVSAGDRVTFRVHDQFLGIIDGGLSYGNSFLCLGSSSSGNDRMQGAVGSSYFAMPQNVPQVMTTGGRLYLGINDTANYSCIKASGLEVRVVQCRTAAGVSYTCN